MRMLERIRESCEHFPDRNAFCIREIYYTYREWAGKATAIRQIIRSADLPQCSKVGVIANDDIETYASIFAIWFEGHSFVPISPLNPKDRNELILQQTELQFILSSSDNYPFLPESHSLSLISTRSPASASIDLHMPEMRGDDILYVLFTSGSTGTPKGVVITRRNFDSFLDSFIEIGFHFTEEDRFLQIYDLSFDASIHCYVLPLCFGACAYTVPHDQVKHTYALKLMQEYQISFTKMPPSTIACLRPYFRDIHLNKIKYCLFGGEPLYADIALEWQQCIPNARIFNVYGPTEATINCTIYDFGPDKVPCKSFNGIVSIGKPFGDTKGIILDENDQPVPISIRGELCISGSQVSPGYLKGEDLNSSSFIKLITARGELTFYRTGDLVMRDIEGDIHYIGRIDDQVQIQGFRVEMGEIEFHARNFPGALRVAAIALPDDVGNMQVHLFLENFSQPTEELAEFLKRKLPYYMLPSGIHCLQAFPETAGRKIDRKALTTSI